MTLVELFTNIANAIRRKDGTSELINAKDFATRIEEIPSGEESRFGDDFPLLDGNTHFWVERQIEEQNDTFEFKFVLIDGELTFNWGDGTSETVTTTGTKQQTITHQYAVGQYRIDIVATGEWRIGSGTSSSVSFSTTTRPLLSYIEIGNNITKIGASAFANTSSLLSLILTSETIVSLSNINAFTGSAIEGGTGYIYVAQALIEDYKVATNWSTYADQFRAIEDYPDIVDSEVAE